MYEFSAYYKEKQSWTSWVTPEHVQAILRSRYGAFFLASKVSYEIMRSTLREFGFRQVENKKARELFRELFRLKWEICLARKPDAPPLVEWLSPRYLPPVVIQQTSAHGVEEAKGGMCSLLLMCVSGIVAIKREQWGYLSPGHPDMSPLGHGPYYLVSYRFNGKRAHEQTHPPLSDVDLILVPFTENIAILKEGLTRMLKVELITEDEKISFERKLVCYSDFVKRVTRVYAASVKLAIKPAPVARKRCTASFTDHLAGPRRSKRNRGAPVAPLRDLNT